MIERAYHFLSLSLSSARLRLRVKAMQQVIDSQAERLAVLSAQRDAAALGRHDESTGQGRPHVTVFSVCSSVHNPHTSTFTLCYCSGVS